MTEEHLPSEARGPASATCATCGTQLQGRYCHSCGERALESDEFRLRKFLTRSFNAVFDVDSRLYRSFRALFTRPGLLTAEYFAGRRRPYLNPIQVFLLANLLFFAGLSVLGGAGTFTTELRYHTQQFGYRGIANDLIARQGVPGSAPAVEFEQRFNDAVPRYANSMVILLAPFLAALLALLHIGRRYPFVHHLVFALHFLAFMLPVLLVFPLVIRAILGLIPSAAPALNSEAVFSTILMLIIAVYLSKATRVAYGTGRGRAIVVGFLASVLLLPAIVVYRMLLFFTVYFSLR